MKRFYFLTGDVDPKEGVCFCRKVEMGRYHVIELQPRYWEEEDDGDTYLVSLSEVDVLAATDTNKTLAASAICLSLAQVAEQQKGLKHPDLIWVELLHQYGSRAPLLEDSGNNYQKLLKLARDESRRLEGDRVVYNRAMSTPKTKMGSTARELMQGDMWTALYPTRLNFNTPVGIELREPVSLGGMLSKVSLSINSNKLNSPDPTAYAMGFMQALAGDGLNDSATQREELTQEYINGYRAGVEAKCTKPLPNGNPTHAVL